jgi:glucose-6-phosphate isomerase
VASPSAYYIEEGPGVYFKLTQYGEPINPDTYFENKVMFQGFLWNINSFDQEGVQLGKVLAKRVLAHDTDGALQVYSEMLGI